MSQHEKSSPIGNLLLQRLAADDLHRLITRLEPVRLPLRNVLIAANAPIGALHFVEAGVVSMLTTMDDGARVEVGLIGPEGVIGLPLLLGAETSTTEAMVQVQGDALRLPAAALRQSLTDIPTLSALLLRYVDAFTAQVAQTAACNARHQIEQRLARWILTTDDRVEGDSFVMTQEFMATMLGVRRPGVTLALGTLQRAGLVRHERGVITVVDRARLEGVACECHGIVQRRYAVADADQVMIDSRSDCRA